MKLPFPHRFWILPIIVLAFATRLYGLDRQSMGFDEIFTVTVARLPWYQGFVALLGHGVQLTPAWYWIIKFWLGVGDSNWVIRVPGALFGVLTIPLIFKLGRYYFNDKVGLLAAFIFAINPYQVWFAQDLRLYSLLPLTAAGAMYGFSRMIRSQGKKGVWLLTFFTFIGLPIHYFMFLISIVQFLYLVITFRRTYPLLRLWIITQVIGISPLILWWLFVIYEWRISVGIGWIPAPRWYTPFLTFWNFNFTYTGDFSPLIFAGLGAGVLGLSLGLWRAWHQFERGLLLTLWLFVPVFLVMGLSSDRISFYLDRYLLIVTPALTLLMVSGLWLIKARVWHWGLIFILIGVTGLNLGRVYFDRESFSKEDWRALVQALDNQAQPGQTIITCTDGHWLSFEYYNNEHRIFNSDRVTFAAKVNELSPSEQMVWVTGMHKTSSVHYLAKSRPPVLDRNLLSVEVADWETSNLNQVIVVPGISAYQYRTTQPKFLDEIVKWHCQD